MKEFNTGGEDTAHISLWIEWNNEILFHIEEWKAAQELGRDGHEDALDERTAGFAAGPYSFDVLPFGYNPGKSKYSYYPYVLISDGIRFCLSEREFKTEHMKSPNARVEIGSLPLMMFGLEECWRRVKDAIAQMGGKIHRNHLSRIDACVDLPGVRVDSFQLAVWEGRFVSRARHKGQYAILADVGEDELTTEQYLSGRRRTGVVIGRSKIVCRIYDKVIESASREDKLAVLAEKRWGNCIPDYAARVEFQLRGEALRNLSVTGKCDQIQTVEDWMKCRADICRYLCTSWLRLYRKEFNASHTERLNDGDLLPAWKRAIDAFLCWTGDSAKKVIRNVKPLRLTAYALLQEGFGCIRSAFVRCGIHFDRDDPRWQDKFCALASRAFKRVLTVDGQPKFMQRQRDAENKLDAALPWNPLGMIA